MQPIWIGCPSANFRKGRAYGFHPEAIVIHIMDGSFGSGESVFRDPTTQKSAHYGVSKEAVVHQYVDENDTAFHAGIVVNPTWSLLKPKVNPNFYTIGIEHEGGPDDVWPDAQMSASAALVVQIAARWGIPLDTGHIIRHHQIRASKTCPGNVVQIEQLLSLIPKVGPPPAAKVTSLRAVRNVNVRRQRPNTASPIDRTLPAGSNIPVVGYTVGERVEGNAYWYADPQGNYVWAGATEVPQPGPAA